MTDFGPEPYVTNIEEDTVATIDFRRVAWTGAHLQLTLMSIAVGEDIGLERHDDTDQFLRIEQGTALVKMGPSADDLSYEVEAGEEFAILVPTGMWHNIINVGDTELKVYSIYAPSHHPHGAVHHTKADAEAAEDH